MPNNIKQTAAQMAQQVLTQLNQQPMQYVKKQKPIFVMRVPSSLSAIEMDRLRDGVAKDGISNDYHILVVPSSATEFEFEMYNADKIQVQKWNELVNRILK